MSLKRNILQNINLMAGGEIEQDFRIKLSGRSDECMMVYMDGENMQNDE